MKRLILVVALLALSAPLAPLSAQSCTAVDVNDYFIRFPACASTLCTTNQPLQLRIDTMDATRSPLACATATWNFDSSFTMGPYPATQAVEPTFQTSGQHMIRVTLTSGTQETVRLGALQTAMGTFHFSLIPPSSMSEGDGWLKFAVTRSNTAGAATCNWNTVNFGPGTTLSHAFGTLSFPDGVATVEHSVAIFDDTLLNGTRSFPFQLSPPAGWMRGSPASFTVSITDNEEPAVVEFAAPVTTVSENAGSVKIGVTRRGNLQIPASVTYAIPEFGSDPSVPRVTGTLTFAAGETQKTIPVPIVDNATVNGNRTLGMRLSQPSAGVRLGSFGSAHAELRIIDDEVPPQIGFGQASYSVAENAGSIAIDVTRTGRLVDASSVTYFLSACCGAVTPTSGQLEFAPGEATRTFVVAISDDSIYDGDTRVSMHLSGTGNATISRSNATLIVIDDDPQPTVSIVGRTVTEGNVSSVQEAFEIVLSAPVSSFTSGRVSFSSGTALNGSDFTAHTAFFQFAAGQTRFPINVVIRGDANVEADEEFFARIDHVSSPELAIGERSAAAIIANDDAAMAPSRVTMRRGTTAEAMIDLGSPLKGDAVISLTSTNPGAVDVPESLTIPAGTARATFVLRGLEAGSARIEAVAPASRGGAAMSILAEVHDGAGVVFTPSSFTMFEGETAEVQVSLDPASKDAQTIELVAPAKLEAPGSITIPAGGSATLTVKALARGAATLRATFGNVTSLLHVDIAPAPNTAALASIAPVTGPHAGGTAFEALGTRFTAGCTLLFGGVPATNVQVVSDSVITGITPPHAAGTVDVVLDCNGNPFVLARAFTYIAEKPSLRNVAPSFGSTGGGTFVRANGANLYSGCWLFFGDSAAHTVETHGTTSMTAVVPAGKAGATDVSVRCDGMTAFLKNGFTYSPAAEPAPSIASIDPLAGSAGEVVTITGSRFRPTDRITFGEAVATIVSSAPDTHVVRIPDLPLGAVSITLTDAAGRVTTTGPIFTILEPRAPEITRATPASVTAGSELVLEGRGFRAPYTFSIGGVTASIVELDYTRAVVRIAADTPLGAQRIEIRNGTGQLAAFGPELDIEDHGVTIASVAPACGSSEGGANVVLTGTGFTPDMTVTFDGALAATTFINATELRAIAPAGATGNAVIAVNGATLTNAFRYASPFDPDGCVAPASKRRSVR